jgi:hypothetical protein
MQHPTFRGPYWWNDRLAIVAGTGGGWLGDYRDLQLNTVEIRAVDSAEWVVIFRGDQKIMDRGKFESLAS